MIFSKTFHSAWAQNRWSTCVCWIEFGEEFGGKFKECFTTSLSLGSGPYPWGPRRVAGHLIHIFRLVPRLSSWVRVPVEQWKRSHFPSLKSLFINNKHSWVAVTHLEANHSDFVCRREVSPLRSILLSQKKARAVLFQQHHSDGWQEVL